MDYHEKFEEERKANRSNHHNWQIYHNMFYSRHYQRTLIYVTVHRNPCTILHIFYKINIRDYIIFIYLEKSDHIQNMH